MSAYFKMDSSMKVLSVLAALASLALIVYGFFTQLFWSGIGLAVFGASMILISGITTAQEQMKNRQQPHSRQTFKKVS